MKTFRVGTALTAVVLASALASSAHAESKSWAAAKGVLPGDLYVVAGGNITSIQKSTIYQTIVPALLQQEKDAKEGFELVKTTCGIDIQTSITDAVVAMRENEKGLIVAALSGVDEAKVTSCLQKIAEKEAKEKGKTTKKITAKTSGKIVEYTMEGESEKLYLAWLASDVVAMATEPTDKSLLEKMIGGKGAVAKSGDMAKALAKTNTNAAVWFALAKKTPVGEGKTKATMKTAYGALDIAAGVVAIDGTMVLSSSAEAKAFADQIKDQIAKNQASMPAEFQKLVKSLTVAASGDAVNVKFSAPEKDILSLIGLAMAKM
jgi:hypothetical protein